MCPNLVGVDLPRHVAGVLAKALAPKENQSQSSPISNLQTKRTVYDSAVVLVQWYLLPAHAQTNWAFFQNKIHQT
jgi:hypothetical protein